MNLEIFQDDDGRFHYQAYEPGRKNARAAPLLCGRTSEGMRKVAWFLPGDRRGRVHFDRGCDGCREALT